VVNSLADGEFYHFYYADGVQFVCDHQATAVWGSWKAPYVIEDASLYLLGPILGFMLRLRGVTCLHASGIVVGNKALAVSGAAGAGKSTLAAAFAASGYPVLADDILPLKSEQGDFKAVPGYARMRLYPNSFQNIAGLPDELPTLAPSWDKCYLDLTAASYSFHRKAVSLQAVYSLDWSNGKSSDSRIIQVKPASAVPLLAANTYRNELLDIEMKKEEFYFLSRLVAQVPVKKVQPIDDIKEIPSLLETIIADFKTI
jgi:hypothetical protein